MERDEYAYKEGDENGGVHENQGQDSCPAVAKAVGDGSSQKDSHKGTTLASLEEGALPFSRNSVRAIAL